MTSEPSAEPDVQYGVKDIQPWTYTALRLQHASVEHLNLTTRRCFIGPIPEGWLNSHRKSWYGEYLSFSNYSSRAATFSASPGISHRRQLTGLDGPSVSAAFGKSFPQPDDVDEEDVEEDGAEDTDPNSQEGDRVDAETTEEGRDGLTSPDRGKLAAHGPLSNLSQSSTEPKNSISDKRQQQNTSQETSKESPSLVKKPAQTQNTLTPKLHFNGSAAKSPPPGSFVTAREFPSKVPDASSDHITGEEDRENPEDQNDPAHSPNSLNASSVGDQHKLGSGLIAQETGTSSTTQLLRPEDSNDKRMGSKLQPSGSASPEAGGEGEEQRKVRNTGLVRFNLDPDIEDTEDRVLNRTASKIGETGRHRIWKRLRRGTAHPGEIVKMEKMLVRVDSTMHELPADFDENDSLEIEVRAVEKWREFVVVCRESTTEGSQFSLQLYKTRVIPAKEQTNIEKRSTHEIPLAKKTTHVNLYSSLDKTLVLWMPWKKGETMIYILRPHSAASAVEWYTFLRNALGWKRPSTLLVNVPDLSVTLQLQNPFNELEKSMNDAQRVEGDDSILSKTMDAEKAVAHTIIQRCLKILESDPEWSDVLSTWLSKERIGLAWKRYDRLEWVHGANEQRMYGTLAMQRTHDLELRPKDHYPTSIKSEKDTMIEPAPVEGFLVRLTSKRGTVQRLGKMYYKRLYFATHNQYLSYTRPAKGLPPPPPRKSLGDTSKVPSKDEILNKTPLIFAVNPYPDDNQDGEVDWLQYGSAASKERHDREAYKESERQVNTMLNAEGYIDLSHIVRVQNFQRGNHPSDANMDQGSEVDFHEEVTDTSGHDGKTQQIDDHRTFELVMKNGLVIRLQAYNEATKKEWIHRLRHLVRYWKLRLADDMTLLKAVRGLNLQKLDLDEEMEAYIGQFGEKWEVTRSVASSKLFNMCGISCCRAITMSGTLYYKPRRHTTFVRCSVILCHGNLIVFESVVRTRTGKELRHIQHDRRNSIALQDCYIYSGLIAGDDLLYQNQTFDSSNPGHNALPRVYLEDGWTSRDEDTMTCFVIWQPRNKSWFKAGEEEGTSGKARQRFRHVSRLGTPGRSIVFRTRSRAERDHWVMNIGMEIERLQVGQDIRVVENPN